MKQFLKNYWWIFILWLPFFYTIFHLNTRLFFDYPGMGEGRCLSDYKQFVYSRYVLCFTFIPALYIAYRRVFIKWNSLSAVIKVISLLGTAYCVGLPILLILGWWFSNPDYHDVCNRELTRTNTLPIPAHWQSVNESRRKIRLIEYNTQTSKLFLRPSQFAIFFRSKIAM